MTAIAETAPKQPSEGLFTPLVLALILHAALLTAAFFGKYFSGPENSWGGPGGSVSVGLVGNMPAVPLPQPDVQTPNRVVDESKGLYQTPKAQPKAEPDAVPIPKFEKNKTPKYKPEPMETPVAPPPKYNSPPSRTLENPVQPPPNAVPYGGGGAPSIPRSSFSFNMGQGATQGGLAFNGVGGGDFGSRFAVYVGGVQRRVSGNWLQSTIDPNLGWAPRVVISFDILREGTVTNVQVMQSSNNYSVDASAVRAVRQSSPLGPLPSEYAGSSVSVQFYFDYRR